MIFRFHVAARVLAALVLGASLVAAAPAGAGAAAAADAAPSRILVRWATDDPAARAAARRAVGLHDAESLGGLGLEAAAVPDGLDAAAVAAALDADPAVHYAEVDAPLASLRSDTYYSQQWGLHNIGQSGGTPDVDIDGPEAWAITEGAGTIVAVLDDGFDVTHPDLQPNLWRNPGEVAGNGIDDDGNGLIDDVHGWDFVNDDATLHDLGDNGHGTHVAGTIGAVADNGIGVAGVAPRAKLMLLKVLGPDGGVTSDAVAAIQYARAHGATVINASWGGSSGTNALRDAISSSGAVFVAAAGNGGSDEIGDDNDASPTYPAVYRLPNLLSVAGVDRGGRLASFSNYGRTTVDVAAPGVDIISTYPSSRYANASGTSMAAPHVAGVAALVKAATGGSASAVVTRIKSTVVPYPALADRTVTGGLVNAAAAVAPSSGTGGGGPASGSGGAPDTPGAAATADVAAGGSLTTDTASDGPTASQPIEVSLTTPVAGRVSLSTWRTDKTITGYDLSAWRADVSAPKATVDAPLTLTFRLLTSEVAGFDPLLVLRDGAPVAACTDVGARPDPCVASTTVAGTTVTITVRSTAGSQWRFARAVAACPGALAPHAGYADVTAGNVHAGSIDCATWWAIATGTGTGYDPATPITRGQMAAFLDRMLTAAGAALPAPGDRFRDIDGYRFEAEIERLAAAGIVNGTAADTYSPGAQVTRAQMASYLVGAYRFLTGAALPAAANRFSDDDGGLHEANIDAASTWGFTSGLTATTFGPGRKVQRDQMATFLVNVLDRLVTDGDVALKLS